MQHVQEYGILSNFQLTCQDISIKPNWLISLRTFWTPRTIQQKQVDTSDTLDFSKGFNTVPHQCLLTKLVHHGIQGDIYRWIDSWLTLRTQRVLVDGESSDFVRVMSGVPQETCWGHWCFSCIILMILVNKN